MPVLLIRVAHPPPGEHLTIHGYVVERTDGGWDEIEAATWPAGRWRAGPGR
jgi:hypothetical protein